MVNSNRKTLVVFFVLLVLLGLFFILYVINESKKDYIKASEDILFQEAVSHYNNMVYTRKWNSSFGGIYVKSDKLKPNPYLENGFILDNKNEKLIKINPAWMTRQISEIANQNGKYKFKITSLNPLNPTNIPNEFEKEALHFFEKNKNNKFYTKLEKDYYNLMGVLKVEKSCLSCHIHQSYKVGDIRGGLSISIPTQNYNKNIKLLDNKTNLFSLFSIIVAFTTVVFGVMLINVANKRSEEIEKLNDNLEKKVKERTLQLEKSNKKLKNLATMDFLTNIPNRRYFFDMGIKSFYLAKRYKNSLSLIVLDIDFFKSVNDTYGHPIGDEILKLVSCIIEKTCRKSDIYGRVGGEEFAILLKNTDIEGAKIFAEKVRSNIEETVYKNDKLEVSITISLGVTVLKEKDKDLDVMYSRSDEALYKAKDNGRNCYKIVI